MNAFSSHRIASRSIIVLILAATAGVGQADEYVNMHMSISFQSSYERCTYPPDCTQVLGQLRVTVRWTVVPKGTRGYVLLADSQQINSASKDTLACSGRVLYTDYPTLVAFSTAIEQYLAQSHTYRLEAQWYRSSTGDWETYYDEYNYEPPEVLQIENRVPSFSQKESRWVRIQHAQAVTEGFDADNDALYSETAQPKSADIYSVIPDTMHGGYYKLAVDARPRGSQNTVYLQLALTAISGIDLDFPSPTANELRFSLLPSEKSDDFKGMPMTVQQYDPCDPSIRFPRWDVKKVMERNTGVLPLADLWGPYDSGVPYAFFTLSFSKAVSADLNDDHVTNLQDFAVLAKDWGKRNVTSIADIAGAKAIGLPDGNVDGYDLLAFCRSLVGINEWLPYGFESGQFDGLPWVNGGDTAWQVVSTNAHGGLHSAQAGNAKGISTLMVKLRCGDGTVSFWRKVSFGQLGSVLQFRIGTTIVGTWSGDSDWQQVSFPVTAGDRIFSWDYVKNGSGTQGANAAWIDDIIFPAK